MRNDLVSAIANALSHPVKVAIIRDLRDGRTVSPVVWAEANGIRIQNSSYHFRSLRTAGILKEVGTRQQRGALEHFYALKGKRAKTVIRALDAIEGKSSD